MQSALHQRQHNGWYRIFHTFEAHWTSERQPFINAEASRVPTQVCTSLDGRRILAMHSEIPSRLSTSRRAYVYLSHEILCYTFLLLLALLITTCYYPLGKGDSGMIILL